MYSASADSFLRRYNSAVSVWMPNAFSSSSAISMTVMESPPRAMKSSSRPTVSTPSIFRQTSAIFYSVGVAGGAAAASVCDQSGSGSRALSVFPFVVIGNSPRVTIRCGHM